MGRKRKRDALTAEGVEGKRAVWVGRKRTGWVLRWGCSAVHWELKFAASQSSGKREAEKLAVEGVQLRILQGGGVGQGLRVGPQALRMEKWTAKKSGS